MKFAWSKIVLLLLACLLGKSAGAASLDGDIRRRAWSLTLTGAQHELRHGVNERLSENRLVGKSTTVQLGSSFLGNRFLSFVSLDFILGPYEPVQADSVTVDYIGTGLTSYFAYAPFTTSLREPNGTWIVSLGARYSDIIGRSVVTRESEAQEAAEGSNNTLLTTTRNYKTNVNDFSGLVGIGYVALKTPRAEGNKENLLMTRIEGYIFQVAVAFPLLTTFNTRFEQTVETKDANGDIINVVEDPNKKKSGHYSGQTFLFSWTTLLGV